MYNVCHLRKVVVRYTYSDFTLYFISHATAIHGFTFDHTLLTISSLTRRCIFLTTRIKQNTPLGNI